MAVPCASLSRSDGDGVDNSATQAFFLKLSARRRRTRTRTAPGMPRTFRPSKSPARTRRSEENVECPLASAEAPPSADAAPVVPTPRLTSPEEKALASSRHQEVMARSKSPPRQLRPHAMPKIPGPACAEAGYQGHSLRKAVRHPILFLSTTPGSGCSACPRGTPGQRTRQQHQRRAAAAHCPLLSTIEVPTLARARWPSRRRPPPPRGCSSSCELVRGFPSSCASSRASSRTPSPPFYPLFCRRVAQRRQRSA